LPAVRLRALVAATLARRTVVSVLRFQIFHGFLQHAGQTILLIVSRDDESHEQLGVRSLVRFSRGYVSIACHLPQRNVVVEPTWERLELAYATVIFDGDVLLLGSSRRSWDGRQEIEQDKGLGDGGIGQSFVAFVEARVGAFVRY
jgi:hypothetical protein